MQRGTIAPAGGTSRIITTEQGGLTPRERERERERGRERVPAGEKEREEGDVWTEELRE